MWTIHKAEECELLEPKKDGSKENGKNNSGDNNSKLAHVHVPLQEDENKTIE